MMTMRKIFRVKLVLMILGEYSFGDHVQDEIAFQRRLEKVMHRMWYKHAGEENA